jgi:PhzF family phenazine biosynthesis protein
MKLQIYQIDAFTSRVFSGNPAAVVPLPEWPEDLLLQAIAAENNVSETAFFVRELDGEADFQLRWFTPAMEVDLCGHATLASAFVIIEHLEFSGRTVRFGTASGPVAVNREEELLVLDFPARPGESVVVSEELSAALGAMPEEVHMARDIMAVYPSEDVVRELAPDLARIAGLDALGVIVTAPGTAHDVDFVSRFFAPRAGIDEDPVTGSAHCTLVPYWAARLGTMSLHARQISKRGGELFCRYDSADGRVGIGGRAVGYLTGTIEV